MTNAYAMTESGLIVPVAPQTMPADPWPAYRISHRACPKCGSVSSIEKTTMGYGSPPDRNKARCECGWRGVADDMVPPSWRTALPDGQLRRLAQRAGEPGSNGDEAVRFTFEQLDAACGEWEDTHGEWASYGEFAAGHIVIADQNFQPHNIGFCLSLAAQYLGEPGPDRPSVAEFADLIDFLGAMLRLDDDEIADPRWEDDHHGADES